MIPYPSINPDIIRIGPFAVRWYGMMYVLGFAASYLLVRYQIAKRRLALHPDFLESFYTYLILGLIVGARLGYVLFYNLSFYIEHPLDVFALWHGGMSFHGGFIGSVLPGAGAAGDTEQIRGSWQIWWQRLRRSGWASAGSAISSTESCTAGSRTFPGGWFSRRRSLPAPSVAALRILSRRGRPVCRALDS